MPKRLYARSLIIVIAPMILLQSVVAFVFMERHWQTVTQRLSTASPRHRRHHRHDRDLSAGRQLRQRHPHRPGAAGLKIDILPPDPLPPPGRSRSSRSSTRCCPPRSPARSTGRSGSIRSAIRTSSKSASSSTTRCCASCAAQPGLCLELAHLPRLDGRHVARAARHRDPVPAQPDPPDPASSPPPPRASARAGRCRPTSGRAAPRGAAAGLAFIQMRERIERQIEQRTAMLTGVSHDLRTILTRFKLQLALPGEGRCRGAQPGHRRHAVDAGRLSRLRARRGGGGPRPLRPGGLFDKLKPRRPSCASARWQPR
jgi:two-component system, OmpR family, osmolarity sensor histidine kinase EnvZ